MTDLATVTGEEREDTVIARVAGEIDPSNAPVVGSGLRQLVSNQMMSLVVDLTEVTYLDSSGIALFFGLASELREHQQTLSLVVDPSGPIARMVGLAGLDVAVAVHETLDAALGT